MRHCIVRLFSAVSERQEVKSPPIYCALLRAISRLSWIRRGLRYRLLRPFAHWSRIKPYQFECDFYGTRYRGDLSHHIDWHVYFFGAYENCELKLLEQISKRRSGIALDIGANVGHHSLFLSQQFQHVHAFEPFDVVRTHLHQKLDINQIENVTVHPVGLGASNDQLPFYAPPERNDGLGSFVPTDSNGSCKTLQVVHGDSYLQEKGISTVDVIKIDIEGFEKYALTGLRRILVANRPIVLMEYGPETQNSFVDESELMSLCPENYEVVKVSEVKTYLFKLKPEMPLLECFDFNSPGGNILLFPREHKVAGWVDGGAY